MQKLEGSCHCGDIKWTYAKPLESVTACNCTVCRRYGALWAYSHKDDGISISGTTKFYMRGKRVEFHFCPRCACLTHYIDVKPEADGRIKCAVNTRMALEPEKIADLHIDHFEGLVEFEDLPRDGRRVRDMWF